MTSSGILDFLQARRWWVIGFVVIVLVGLITLLAVASQNSVNQATANQKKPLAGNTATVTLTWLRGTENSAETYREVIDDFRKIYPNTTINISYKPYGTEYYNNLIADIAADAGPDIFMLRGDDLAAYKRYMTPIRQFTGNDLYNYRNDFADMVVRDTMDIDKVYGVTSSVDTLQLYYNKDILNQNSIALPPTTWSDLDKQVTQLTKATSRDTFIQSAIALGTGYTRTSPTTGNVDQFKDIIPALLMQYGANIYNYQNRQATLTNDKNTTDALNYYLSFANSTSSKYTWNNDTKNSVDAFADGSLAYMINYSSAQDQLKLKNPKLNYSIAPLPQQNPAAKKTTGVFFMDGLNRQLESNAIRTGAKQEDLDKREIAENFLYFLSLSPQQQKLATKNKLPGARKDILTSQGASSDSLKVFADGVLYSDNYYKPCVAKIEDLWGSLFFDVHYQTGTFAKNSKNDPKQDALQNRLQQTVQSYSTLSKQTCLR